MADNRYRKYLDRDESPRFSISDALGGVVKAGAFLAGGAGAYAGLKYLNKGGMVSRGINRAGKAVTYLEGYASGLNKTFESSGVINTLIGGANKELEANLTKAFRPYGVGAQREIEGTASRFEQMFSDRAVAMRDMKDSVITSTRLDTVLSEVKELDALKNNPEALNAFEEAIRNDKNLIRANFEKGNRTPINTALDDAIARADIMRKFPNDQAIQTNSVRDQIGEILARHGDRNQFIKENIDVITAQIKAVGAQMNKALPEHLSRPTFFSHVIENLTGYKRMTVDQAMGRGLFNTTSLDIVKKADGELQYQMFTPRGLSSIEGLGRAPIDPNVFVNERGQVMDLRFPGRLMSKGMTAMSNAFQIPLINIRPFRLLSVFNRHSLDKNSFAIFNRGTRMPLIGNGVDVLKDDMFFYAGKLMDRSGSILDTNMKLAESKFGLFQREGGAMAGISRFDGVPLREGVRGTLQGIFDIGRQEYQGALSRKFSGLTKFWNLDWARNLWYNMTDSTKDIAANESKLQDTFNKFLNIVDNRTSGLDRTTLEALEGYIVPSAGREVYDTLMSGTSGDSTIQAIYKLTQSGDKVKSPTEFNKIINRYVRNPQSFERVIRTVKTGYSPVLPDMFESAMVSNTELITNLNQAEKLLHMELLSQAQDLTKNVTIGSIARELFESGKINQKQMDNMMDLYVLNDLRNMRSINGKPNKAGLETFAGFLQQPTEVQDLLHKHLERMVMKSAPMMGEGPGIEPLVPFRGNEFVPVRGIRNPIGGTLASINSILKGGGSVQDIIKAFGNDIRSLPETTIGQMGLGPKSIRAGRGNTDKITNLTYASYHYLFRLNEGLSALGLGLSTENLGSTQDIAKNLFLKRLLYPLIGITGLSYLNYELGNVMGDKPGNTLAKAYASSTVGMQGLKDITGLNAIGQGMNRMLPGFDKLYENPLGLAIKYGSFGLFGDVSGRKEKQYYYEKGYDVQRKGRFWGLGSSTPWYGGRTEYFAPSWYRQTIGQPMMTDTMYGSESEYWSQSWLPNPRNPLGLLKRIIDPYHWENKHMKDRPYPISGGVAELEAVPIVGPFLGGTIGRIIKPTRRHPGLEKAHETYLKEINEMYKSFIEKANSGSMILVYPGGRILPVSNTGEGVEGGGGEPGYVGGNGIAGGGGTGIAPVDGGIAVVDPTLGFAPGRGRAMLNSQLSRINQSYVSYSNVKPIDGRSIQLLRDHTYVDSLDAAMDPNSAAFRMRETAYSLTEIGGMYGFLFNTMFGDPGAASTAPVLQSSMNMLRMNRFFWEQNMGGLGGELSEIYRRFLPRKRRQKEYNPIRNTMPDWMPGLDYFTDFKHGDPYAKIPKGEMRLPGAGYESINKLHSDPYFGRYGAFDRYKILADIAPWSEQYRYYTGVISKMHGLGLLSEDEYSDVQRIRDMVKQRKEKYDLYPYRFKYANEIKKRSVVVGRIIDPVTFTAEGDPDTPIRLAGIKLPAKTSENYEEITTELKKYLTPGKRLTIGIESDTLNRVKDDVMGTTQAVIYDALGDPVQARLARKYKNIKADWEDYSATAVNSLYYQNQITVGKAWEWFAHLDTPFHTKFLQIRSPLEMYERQLLYGKEWQSWGHPIRDWVGPTMDRITSGNPLIGTGVGAALGSLFTAFSKKNKAIGAIVGGMIGGIAPSIRAITQGARRLAGNNDYTWIPQRRILERDINEYFDMIKYVKYRGLFEKTRRLAMQYEGVDPQALLDYSEQSSGKTGKEKRQLAQIKRLIKISTNLELGGLSDDEKSKLKSINDRINQISQNKLLIKAGPLTMRALQYEAESKATLYGADPNGDLQVIYKSLPAKDRPMFKYFMTATPKEREKILRLVPKNQRRFYEAKWGLPIEKKPGVEEYFLTHYLPDPSWEGWSPETSLEEVKLKFVQNTAIDIGEFGFWAEDVEYAKNAPKIGKIENPLGALDLMRLKRVLEGRGLRDADITISTEITDDPSDLYSVSAAITHDRRSDVNRTINDNIASLMA